MESNHKRHGQWQCFQNPAIAIAHCPGWSISSTLALSETEALKTSSSITCPPPIKTPYPTEIPLSGTYGERNGAKWAWFSHPQPQRSSARMNAFSLQPWRPGLISRSQERWTWWHFIQQELTTHTNSRVLFLPWEKRHSSGFSELLISWELEPQYQWPPSALKWCLNLNDWRSNTLLQ